MKDREGVVMQITLVKTWDVRTRVAVAEYMPGELGGRRLGFWALDVEVFGSSLVLKMEGLAAEPCVVGYWGWRGVDVCISISLAITLESSGGRCHSRRFVKR